jgi:threonine dehydrogenase-like Zn-dependent dehydrogenase
MKAVVYNGPRDVQVKQVPDPKIEHPADAIVRITSTNICGSDLHMYEGRTRVEHGKVLGHENLGEIVEVGSAVESLKKGDMVCLPFNISCGYCENCERGHAGRAHPSFIVSHRLTLDDAPDACRHFDHRDEGWIKVVLKAAA